MYSLVIVALDLGPLLGLSLDNDIQALTFIYTNVKLWQMCVISIIIINGLNDLTSGHFVISSKKTPTGAF